MTQKKFLCTDIQSAKEALGNISGVLRDTPHRSALLNFYEKGFSGDEIAGLIQYAREVSPDIAVAGISVPLVAELMPEGTGILLNLILTTDSDIEVVTMPCLPGNEDDAAAILRSHIDSHTSVKAVELFGSNMELNTTRFMVKAMEGHEDAILFGTTTIRNLPTKMSVEESDNTVEVEQVGPDAAGDEFVVGDGIQRDGFVAVIFAGEKLKVKTEYALGWKPIGRKLSLEFGERAKKGETVITAINGMPAVDIYREYLGVYPDSYLISNICEFPFIVERGGISICLIPIDCGRDGELYFMMTLDPGEQISFTFASHDEVLGASRNSIEEMERFSPEALFLTLCGNRINFLKEDAHLEWDGFRAVCPDNALMHGACELYYHNGWGGILNSAHLATGMREGDDIPSDVSYDHPTVESLRHGRTMSLSDRMSVFLGRITTELLDMAQEARDANNAKSAFLSHMSHEIRTPINAILGMDEMILQESTESSTLEYANSIHSAGNNLLSIVNDVLDFSKIEAGRMNIIPAQYELTSVINDLYNVVRLRAEAKGLSVVIDIDPKIPSVLYGDATRIRQVITNILTNAVKYTEKGKVTFGMKLIGDVSAKDFPKTEGWPERSVRLRAWVKDTGIGIKSEDMGRLFDEYERVDEKRNRMVEGTGLGLSITKQLLELMGSSLHVESTYGKGSEFAFEIVQGVVKDAPVGKLSARFAKTPAGKHHTLFTAEDARILVVDDSAVNLSVIRNLLKKTKIAIDTAASGEEALQYVTQNEYDVIFIDHLMPGMDGLETLKKMKDLENNMSAKKPVICLTANAVSDSGREYIKAGFKDYLSKPINIRELEDMLFKNIPPEKIRTLQGE